MMLFTRFLGKDQTTRMMEREIIEIAPLAYMQGTDLGRYLCHPRWSANTTIVRMKCFDPVFGLTLRWLSMEIPARLTFREMSNRLDWCSGNWRTFLKLTLLHFSAKDVVRHPVALKECRAWPVPNPVLKKNRMWKKKQNKKAKIIGSCLRVIKSSLAFPWWERG